MEKNFNSLTEMLDSMIAESKTVKEVDVIKVEPKAQNCEYVHGQLVAVNGEKVAKGYTPKSKRTSSGARVPKNDPVKDAIKTIFTNCIKGHAVFGKDCFNHTSEGLIVRMPEADYSIKITHSKEMKYDETQGFECDYTVRGKAKNSAPAIAKALFNELNLSYVVVSVKASGIIIHREGQEYTVKISKKRDRVGFEAEKAQAFE